MGRFPVLLGVLVIVTVSSVPARAESGPPPQPVAQAAPAAPPAHRPRHRRMGLVAAGLTTWGVTYAVGVMAALSTLGSYNTCTGSPACTAPGNSEAGELLIPVAGPWIAIGAQPKDAGLLAILGLGQAVGVTLLTVGVVGRADDGPPVDEPRPRTFVSFGVLPTHDGAFGFLSGRM